jgi:ribosomal protein L37AE/L43A
VTRPLEGDMRTMGYHATDFQNLPTTALIERGLMNEWSCKDAITELRNRHAVRAVTFLENYLNNVYIGSGSKQSEGQQYSAGGRQSRKTSVLDSRTGKCQDCGRETDRKFNGYWQCENCGARIKTAGARYLTTITKKAA